MSEMGSEQVQHSEIGLGRGGLEKLDIEPGEHGPAEPAESTLGKGGASGALDRASGMHEGTPGALDSAAGGHLDVGRESGHLDAGRESGQLGAGREMGSSLDIGAGLAEPGESGPAEPEAGLTAEHRPDGDAVPGRSATGSSTEALSETAGALPGRELTEPGEAGPAEAVDAFEAGNVTAALYDLEAAKDLAENVATAVEAVDPFRRQ